MYQRNLNLLFDRFPAIAFFAPSFSVGAPPPPLPFSWPKPLPDVELLYLYGLSIEAYEKLLPWMLRHPARRLVFLESDETAFSSLLHDPKAGQLLSDPAVELFFLPKGRALDPSLQSLAESHPVQTLDFLALPHKQGSRFRSIRLKLLRKTTLASSLFAERLHAHQPFAHFLANAPRIAQSFYFNRLNQSLAGVPAIICGAGPSLKSSFDFLRQLENRALIFACGSAIPALSAAGISPHFCIAIDPNPEEFRRFTNQFAFEIPFLYSTRVHPDLFATANGPFGYIRSGLAGNPELWLDQELGFKEPLLTQHLDDETLTVTPLAIAAARLLGSPLILLAGLDMAYTGGQRYSAEVGVVDPVQKFEGLRTPDGRLLAKKGTGGSFVVSSVRWLMESASIARFAKTHAEIRFINVTDGGIGFEGIPYRPFAEAMDQLRETYDLRGLIHAAISRAKMPETAKQIPEKLDRLKQSLLRSIRYLEILAGRVKGSPALAEVELIEEEAYKCLFYDMPTLLEKMLRSEAKEKKWECFLELARKFMF